MNEKNYQRLLASVRKKLSASHIPWVAEASGVSDKALRLIASGETIRPRPSTLEAIKKAI